MYKKQGDQEGYGFIQFNPPNEIHPTNWNELAVAHLADCTFGGVRFIFSYSQRYMEDIATELDSAGDDSTPSQPPQPPGSIPPPVDNPQQAQIVSPSNHTCVRQLGYPSSFPSTADQKYLLQHISYPNQQQHYPQQQQQQQQYSHLMISPNSQYYMVPAPPSQSFVHPQNMPVNTHVTNQFAIPHQLVQYNFFGPPTPPLSSSQQHSPPPPPNPHSYIVPPPLPPQQQPYSSRFDQYPVNFMQTNNYPSQSQGYINSTNNANPSLPQYTAAMYSSTNTLPYGSRPVLFPPPPPPPPNNPSPTPLPSPPQTNRPPSHPFAANQYYHHSATDGSIVHPIWTRFYSHSATSASSSSTISNHSRQICCWL
jgi:hypothetical protein